MTATSLNPQETSTNIKPMTTKANVLDLHQTLVMPGRNCRNIRELGDKLIIRNKWFPL